MKDAIGSHIATRYHPNRFARLKLAAEPPQMMHAKMNWAIASFQSVTLNTFQMQEIG
jgi:hypothetical protein